MSDDLEDLLERASHVRPRPVDPDGIWATGTKRRRARRTVQAATTTLVVLALATPLAITASRDLATPGVDVADVPDGTIPATPSRELGCEDVADRDDVPVTRARGATVILAALEAAEVPLPASPPDRFVDDDGSVAEHAIDRLAGVGILQGTSGAPERFAPNDPLTRGQLASLLVRSYERATGDRLAARDDPFRDDDGTPHETDNAKAAAAGLLPAITHDTFASDAGADENELSAAADRLARLLAGDELCRP